MTERTLTITKLKRHPEHGYWMARVSTSGETVQVDRRYGSWQAEVRAASRVQRYVRKDVPAWVAAALQAKVRPLEKRERAQIADACERERERRLLAWVGRRTALAKPGETARRRGEIIEEMAAELRGVSLERLLTEPGFAWARRD